MDLRDAVSLGPGGAPCVAKRRLVETLGLEQLGARRELLLALANAAAPPERGQQRLVHAPVERSELQPLLEIAKDLVTWGVADELLQQRGWQPPDWIVVPAGTVTAAPLMVSVKFAISVPCR